MFLTQRRKDAKKTSGTPQRFAPLRLCARGLPLWLGCLGLVFAAATSSFATQVTPRVPVVLSTDVGNEIDDQWAIVYLSLLMITNESILFVSE